MCFHCMKKTNLLLEEKERYSYLEKCIFEKYKKHSNFQLVPKPQFAGHRDSKEDSYYMLPMTHQSSPTE